LGNVCRHLPWCSNYAFAGKICDEFRPVFAPTGVADRRFDATRFQLCFMINFVPENYCRVGRDLVEITNAVVRRVFNRRIGATNKNSGDTNRKKFSSEDAYGLRRNYCISAPPAALDRIPYGFTGHVAHPVHSIRYQLFVNRGRQNKGE
jgi:hypothetical protein